MIMKCPRLLQLFFAVLTVLQLQFYCSEAVSLRETGRDKVPLDYLTKTKEDIADKEGSPKNLETAPTIIHCLQDKAVVDNEFRAKPVGEEGAECGAIGMFLFDWEAVADTTSLALSKSILRPYVQVASQLLKDHEAIPVNISVSLQLYHKNMTLDNDSDVSTSFQLVQTVNVTSESEGWMELDITAFILSVWSPVYKQSPFIEVTLQMEVDCVQHTKVPIEFINPAEVELEDTILRAQCVDLQPLLLVYFEDLTLKQVIKDEKKLAEERKNFAAENEVNSNSGLDSLGTRRRKKRSHQETDCKLRNFTLHFNELLIPADFIYPQFENLGICSGGCSYVDILPVYPRPPHHARMTALAMYHYESRMYKTPNSVMYRESHKNPCCSAIGYNSIYLIISMRKSIRMTLFPDMIATECGCR